ncbi:hypothetical protein BU16DRAFT_535490 [Lophium mytilinum]|uniref:Uncharacterized protein n=1 Tax=Lophium mytilinum TaxID=390894 RepID=A0A6A6R5R3_9PEZI|nr:hypothetical protein BU16DRAFT_535490 [Lophium mytilinum]
MTQYLRHLRVNNTARDHDHNYQYNCVLNHPPYPSHHHHFLPHHRHQPPAPKPPPQPRRPTSHVEVPVDREDPRAGGVHAQGLEVRDQRGPCVRRDQRVHEERGGQGAGEDSPGCQAEGRQGPAGGGGQGEHRPEYWHRGGHRGVEDVGWKIWMVAPRAHPLPHNLNCAVCCFCDIWKRTLLSLHSDLSNLLGTFRSLAHTSSHHAQSTTWPPRELVVYTRSLDRKPPLLAGMVATSHGAPRVTHSPGGSVTGEWQIRPLHNGITDHGLLL